MRRRTGPGDPELLSDVDEMISAHSAREIAAQDEDGLKKEEEGSGEQAEAAPGAL